MTVDLHWVQNFPFYQKGNSARTWERNELEEYVLLLLLVVYISNIEYSAYAHTCSRVYLQRRTSQQNLTHSMPRSEKRCRDETAVIAIMRIFESIHVFSLRPRLSLAHSLRSFHSTIYSLLCMRCECVSCVSWEMYVTATIWVRSSAYWWFVILYKLQGTHYTPLTANWLLACLLLADAGIRAFVLLIFQWCLHCKTAWNYFHRKLSTLHITCHAMVGSCLPHRLPKSKLHPHPHTLPFAPERGGECRPPYYLLPTTHSAKVSSAKTRRVGKLERDWCAYTIFMFLRFFHVEAAILER